MELAFPLVDSCRQNHPSRFLGNDFHSPGHSGEFQYGLQLGERREYLAQRNKFFPLGPLYHSRRVGESSLQHRSPPHATRLP